MGPSEVMIILAPFVFALFVLVPYWLIKGLITHWHKTRKKYSVDDDRSG